MRKILPKIFVFRKMAQKLKEDHVKEYATECAYFMILSVVPFIMFFLTLSSHISIFNKEIILDLVDGYLSHDTLTFFASLLDEIYARSVGTLSITAIVVLWSASKGFYYLSRGLKVIYAGRKRVYPLERFQGILYTICMILAIYSFMILFVFGKKIHLFVSEYVPNFAFMTSLLLKLRWIVLIFVLFIICLFIYRFIPRHDMGFKDQIFGALFASVGWAAISWGLSVFVNIFTGFSKIYGSLTTVMLILMWFYFCMYIILLGAEINYFAYQYNQSEVYKKIFFNKKKKNVKKEDDDKILDGKKS